jgi:glycosyltransferase involved in cell wall biosynthesis
MRDGRGLRVAVDWHRVRPGDGDGAGVGRYQRALTVALAAGAAPADEVWALIARPHAADVIGPGIAHAGVGRSGRDRGEMLRVLGVDAAIFVHELPDDVTVPAAVVMHDVLPVTHPDWVGRAARSRGGEATIAALRDAGLVIAPSEVARIDVLSVADVPEERVVVVPPTVAPEFAERSHAGSRVAAHRGLGRYCVALGDASPRGNLGHLVEAVMRAGRGATLVSPLVPPRRARDAEGVLFIGPLGDAERADLLAGAAFAAAVGFADGCGLGALEALACGIPVVVSDRGALVEVAGDAALVVPPTVNAIAEGIAALGEDGTAARLRAAGPARAAAYRAHRTGPVAWAAVAQLRDRVVRTQG